MSQTLDALIVELRADVRGLQTSLSAAAGDVSRFSKTASANVDGFQASVNRARTAVLSLGTAWAAFRVGKSIVDAGVQLEALQAKMGAATGSAEAAAAGFQFARDEADRLGLDVRAVADGFASFAASALRAGLTLGETQNIFTGVSEATVGLRLSAEKTQLVFMALSQMASKGTVSMEELKQQMGESLPGALQVFAKAMGKGNDEFIRMVENGEVTTADLKKLGEGLRNDFGKAAEEAANGAQAAFNKLGNALFDLQTKMADAGFLDVVTEAVQDLTDLINDPSTSAGLVGFAQLMADIASAAMRAASALGSFYTQAGKAIEKAGDSAFSAVFGQEGADAIALARKAKANGINMEAQRAIDAIQARGGFQFGGAASGNGTGLSGEGAFPATGAAPVSDGYTLGTLSQPGESEKARKERERAAKQAEAMRERLRSQVDSMAYGFASPEEQAALEAEKQQELLREALEAKAITEQEFRELGLEAELAYQDELTRIRQDATDKEIAMREKASELENRMRENVIDNAIRLLNVFAGENKAIAMTMLAFDKARAIAQAVMETHVAAAAALKYDPSGATSAYVMKLGYLNVATIAATGIAQLATMGSGSSGSRGSGGGASAGYASEYGSGGGSMSGQSSVNKSVYITLNGDDAAFYNKTQIRKLIEGINDAIGDGSQLRVAVS